MLVKSRTNALNAILYSPHKMRQEIRFSYFLDAYIDCEAFAVKLIEYYKKDMNKPLSKTNNLRVDTLIKAMQHFKVSFNNQTIYKIFSSYKYKNKRYTARQLRNAYVHGRKNVKANALLDQYEQLTNDMQDFVMSIAPLLKTTSHSN